MNARHPERLMHANAFSLPAEQWPLLHLRICCGCLHTRQELNPMSQLRFEALEAAHILLYTIIYY